MKNLIYIAEVHGQIVKVADTFQEAFSALPMVNTGQCFGETCKKIGIVYRIEKDSFNLLQNNEESENIETNNESEDSFEDKQFKILSHISNLSDKDLQQMIINVLQVKYGESESDFFQNKDKDINRFVQSVIDLLKKSIVALFFGKHMTEEENLKINYIFEHLLPKLPHRIKANYSQLCNVAYLRRFKNKAKQDINENE